MSNISFEERISEKIIKRLNLSSTYDKREISKISYGVNIFIINSAKLIVIYLFALIFGCIKETFITHISFYLIRRNAYGAHAKRGITCNILGIIMFVILPITMNFVTIYKPTLVIIALLNSIILFIYAPGITNKNPINNKNRLKRHKTKSVFANFIALIFIISIKNLAIITLIALGITMASLLVLPISNKILGEL